MCATSVHRGALWPLPLCCLTCRVLNYVEVKGWRTVVQCGAPYLVLLDVSRVKLCGGKGLGGATMSQSHAHPHPHSCRCL